MLSLGTAGPCGRAPSELSLTDGADQVTRTRVGLGSAITHGRCGRSGPCGRAPSELSLTDGADAD
eukprot:scaffold90143_cov36-Phaeocystis_antarctica.AAC.1